MDKMSSKSPGELSESNESSESCPSVMTQLKGLAGATGLIVFWTGSWSFIDYNIAPQGIVAHPAGDESYNMLHKGLSLAGVGILMLILTNSFFSEAGMNMKINPLCGPNDNWHPAFRFLHSLFSLLASVCFWVGCSNLMEYWVIPKHLWWDVGCFVGGLILILISGSFLTYAGIYVHDADDYDHATTKQRIIYVIRACIALIGALAFWKGIWNVMTEWTIDASLWRDVIYALIGLVTVLVTNNITAVLSRLAETRCCIRWRLILLHVHALITMCSGCMLWIGVWNLLDLHIRFPNNHNPAFAGSVHGFTARETSTTIRNSSYVFVGLVLLLLTDSLGSNAPASPVSFAAVSRDAKKHTPTLTLTSDSEQEGWRGKTRTARRRRQSNRQDPSSSPSFSTAHDDDDDDDDISSITSTSPLISPPHSHSHSHSHSHTGHFIPGFLSQIGTVGVVPVPIPIPTGGSGLPKSTGGGGAARSTVQSGTTAVAKKKLEELEELPEEDPVSPTAAPTTSILQPLSPPLQSSPLVDDADGHDEVTIRVSSSV